MENVLNLIVQKSLKAFMRTSVSELSKMNSVEVTNLLSELANRYFSDILSVKVTEEGKTNIKIILTPKLIREILIAINELL